MWSQQIISLLTLFGPLIGALFSVFLGFILNRHYEKHVDNKARTRILHLIVQELKKDLEIKEGNLLQIWEVMVSSGCTILLDNEELRTENIDLIELAKVYYIIKMHNCEAKRLKRF